MNIYESLSKGIRDLTKLPEERSGLDDFLSGQKVASLSDLVENRIKVSSMADLVNFSRISEDTLVHKAKKDLWRISESEDGVYIERLFDPNTDEPLKV